MQRDSARALKKELKAALRDKGFSGEADGQRDTGAHQPAVPHLSIGVSGRGENCRVAVRLHHAGVEEAAAAGPALDFIRRKTAGEVDVKHVGRLKGPPDPRPAPAPARARPWYRSRNRPLLIGSSVAHKDVTMGTLGCFVRPQDGSAAILSNNHVMANQNLGRPGDAVLQPGPWDTHDPESAPAARLLRFVKLHRSTPNLVDAALATVDAGIDFDPARLKGLGNLRGVRQAPLREGTIVHKVGRTTGVSTGRIGALEIDDVPVGYPALHDVHFDDQLEVTGNSDRPFSGPGDSGALVVDEDLRAVGLLFASNDDPAVSYVNPIDQVLSDLAAELMC